MTMNAFFIDGNWCHGCHSCETACREERKFGTADQTGIKVVQVGVWDYEGADGKKKWQHSYFVIPTDQCALCAGSSHQGSRPICTTVCPAQCIEAGDFDELTAKVTNPRQMVFRVK